MSFLPSPFPRIIKRNIQSEMQTEITAILHCEIGKRINKDQSYTPTFVTTISFILILIPNLFNHYKKPPPHPSPHTLLQYIQKTLKTTPSIIIKKIQTPKTKGKKKQKIIYLSLFPRHSSHKSCHFSSAHDQSPFYRRWGKACSPLHSHVQHLGPGITRRREETQLIPQERKGIDK